MLDFASSVVLRWLWLIILGHFYSTQVRVYMWCFILLHVLSSVDPIWLIMVGHLYLTQVRVYMWCFILCCHQLILFGWLFLGHLYLTQVGSLHVMFHFASCVVISWSYLADYFGTSLFNTSQSLHVVFHFASCIVIRSGLPTARQCRESAWPWLENYRGSLWDCSRSRYSHVAK